MTRKFRHEPTPKQFDALKLLYDANTEYILFGGGAGGGKSWVGCEWLLSMCLNYPGIRLFVGRKELKELKATTLLTLFKVCNHHNINPNDIFKYRENKSSIDFLNGSMIMLLDLRYMPSDPMYESLGSSEYTSGWIEEGGEINFNAFDTLKSRVGRHFNDKYNIKGKIFITCNPKKNWLYHTFYKPNRENKLPSTYKFIQSLVTDNPHIEKDYINKLNELKDKAKKARLLLGQWEYDDDPAALCDYDKIVDVFTNTFIEKGPGYITADIARFGKDRTIIIVWSGFRAEKIIQLNGKKVTEVAEAIKKLQAEYKIPNSNVVVDEDGVGGGVVDILSCKGFVNNSKPIALQGVKEEFDNLKSQCSFKFAERLNESGYYINVDNDEDMRETIIEELEVIKQKEVDSEKKKAVIPREDEVKILGRSPDVKSSLIMREFFELRTKIRFRTMSA
jgi:PBSX family phage terminase large subunit